MSRLSFEPRLFLKCRVPLGEKWLLGKKCKKLECGQNSKTGNRDNILKNIMPGGNGCWGKMKLSRCGKIKKKGKNRYKVV